MLGIAAAGSRVSYARNNYCNLGICKKRFKMVFQNRIKEVFALLFLDIKRPWMLLAVSEVGILRGDFSSVV